MQEHPGPSSPEAREKFLDSLKRYERLRELDATDPLVRKEREIAWNHWATLTLLDGATPSYPGAYQGVIEALGLAGTPSGQFAGELGRLGPSPSRLLPSDPNAQVQLGASREVTDYAGIFQRSGVFLAGNLNTGTFLATPMEVRFVGEVEFRSGRLATFDPTDPWARRTVQELDREVPLGRARVFVAREGRDSKAVLFLFGSNPVVGWAPARVNAHQNPMYIPPKLPMSAVRYGIGLGELAVLASERAGESMSALREALSGTPDAIVGGLVGVKGEGPVPSDWGLDAGGKVAAYAVDFGSLRLHSGGLFAPSMPAVQLTCPSLTERLRPAYPDLPEEELVAMARALGARVLQLERASRISKLANELDKIPGYQRLCSDWLMSPLPPRRKQDDDRDEGEDEGHADEEESP